MAKNPNLKYPWKILMGKNCIVEIYETETVSLGTQRKFKHETYRKSIYEILTSRQLCLTWLGSSPRLSILCPGNIVVHNRLVGIVFRATLMQETWTWTLLKHDVKHRSNPNHNSIPEDIIVTSWSIAYAQYWRHDRWRIRNIDVMIDGVYAILTLWSMTST